MTIKAGGLLFLGILISAALIAAESLVPEALVAPGQVTLGISLIELRVARPNAFDGPEATRPNDPQKRKWPTMMEVVDLGQPSQVSFLYLFSNDKLIGLLRTRNLVLMSPDGRIREASSAYAAFTRLLGESRQESVLRKGDSSYVPVRADVWADDVGRRSFYFIATTREITTAVVAVSDFPIEQVMIRPDPSRFDFEDKATQTVTDLPRSTVPGEGAAPIITPITKSPLPISHQRVDSRQQSSVNTPEKDQSKDDTQSFMLWTLVSTITIGVAWLALRAASKSRRG
jgi:hypothetical protein